MNKTCNKLKTFILLLCIFLSAVSCANFSVQNAVETYTLVNNNIPQFASNEITDVSFEQYSELDSLGRCGVAIACIGTDLMPTKNRGSIGQIKPSGWQIAKYDIVDGKYLYNRCHLIGYQLSGENANEKNLITGTRYFNTEGMLPFENKVADYVKETGNHVMYRVTPIFENINLIASGVQIEAYSVEDGGNGVSFNVFVNNIQPGIKINYLNGTSMLESEGISDSKAEQTHDTQDINDNKYEHGDTVYILNTSTKKFHFETCSSVEEIKKANKETFDGSKKWLVDNGYSPCGVCKP